MVKTICSCGVCCEHRPPQTCRILAERSDEARRGALLQLGVECHLLTLSTEMGQPVIQATPSDPHNGDFHDEALPAWGESAVPDML